MKWLHISDLHCNPKTENFDTKQILGKLKQYITEERISVDNVFYTGDFRFAKTQTKKTETADAKNAADQLREIAGLAGVRDPGRIHIVPGNHDLDRAEGTEDAYLLKGIYDLYSRNSGAFPDTINHGGTEINALEYLSGRFAFFENVARELGNQVWTGDVLRKQIHCSRAYAGYNILYLNTAIASNGGGERGSLVVGYEHIHKALEGLNTRLPTIALGHHGLDCFERKEAGKIKALFRGRNIRIYLCGDAHVGDADMADDALQITAGCLRQNNRGEQIFYVGTMGNDGVPAVQAHRYLDGAHSGWSDNKPLTKATAERIMKIFPQAAGGSAGRPIFGRDKEIYEIAQLLRPQQGEALEVFGIGGIGKTTVCKRVLEILENDGINCVSVTARNSATADVQRDILLALGIDAIEDEISPDKYAETLLEKAKESRRVLYIDNAETPIANDKAAFRAWFYSFARESGWRIMHSTQLSIGDNIKHHPMEPLQTGDAYSMFEEHWGEIPAEAEKERQAAQRIVTELLSGHPLAIEIAASPRLKRKYSKPSRLEKEIRDGDENLKRDGDPAKPHNSMSATLGTLGLIIAEIEKSAVAEHAKTVWSIIAQYPGEFSDDLFSLTFAEDPDYKEALYLLREFSLVANEYAMLEPIKKEAPSDAETKKSSRAKLFGALSALFGKGDDLHSADRQKWHEMSLSSLQPALKLLREADPDDFDMLKPVVFSMLNYFTFSAYASAEALRKLARLYREKHDNLGLANALKSLGNLENRLGGVDEARRHYEEAERLYQDERDNLGLANALKSLGDLERRLGGVDEARRRYEEAEHLYRDERDNLGLANALKSLGDLERRLGDVDEARRRYEEAERLYRDERDNLGLANALKSLGNLEMGIGGDSVPLAIDHYRHALELYEREREPMGRAYCLAKLCLVHAKQGDAESALAYSKAAADALEAAPESVAAYVRECIGKAEEILGIRPGNSGEAGEP